MRQKASVYDGNGRLGRYLFSKGMYDQEQSYGSFLISTAVNTYKNKYYKAFKAAEDPHACGSVNEYVETMLSILIHQYEDKRRI